MPLPTDLPRRAYLTIKFHGWQELGARIVTSPLRLFRGDRRARARLSLWADQRQARRWYREKGRPVTIVMPTYGDPSTTIDAVRRLRRTVDRSRTRFIVVDDGSDATDQARLREITGRRGRTQPFQGAGGTVRSTSAADVAIQLSYARLVVVVPGYGMAVAQAQRAVADLAAELDRRGVEVLYGIHPVAGRMPGHMNVLLAEADVPYDQLKEMDDINGEFARTDVALVIGANDVTNPAARTVTDSPIYGMPILDVDKAGSVIVLKRSMSSGFAGIDNPLFYNEKTAMLFGDAKASVSEVLSEVQAV